MVHTVSLVKGSRVLAVISTQGGYQVEVHVLVYRPSVLRYPGDVCCGHFLTLSRGEG